MRASATVALVGPGRRREAGHEIMSGGKGFYGARESVPDSTVAKTTDIDPGGEIVPITTMTSGIDENTGSQAIDAIQTIEMMTVNDDGDSATLATMSCPCERNPSGHALDLDPVSAQMDNSDEINIERLYRQKDRHRRNAQHADDRQINLVRHPPPLHLLPLLHLNNHCRVWTSISSPITTHDWTSTALKFPSLDLSRISVGIACYLS